ncbi:MAG: dihydroorotase [Flavobacteriales bacterium]
MRTLLQSAWMIDPTSPLHGKKRDVLIEDGIILEIATKINPGKVRVVKMPDLAVSPGWIDTCARFMDPGFEEHETLESGIRAAQLGGFRKVLLMPSTSPAVDRKSSVDYIRRQGSNPHVELLVAGCISEARQGKQLAEIVDMKRAGALAFTDDKQPVGTELMSRALHYALQEDALIMTFPHDAGLAPGGQMHEGPISVELGMKGIPSMAEEIRLMRDIELLRYHGGRMHVALISTARSVEIIRQAKRQKLKITCGVAAHQLVYRDHDLRTFDTNYKVLPPFRSDEDVRAIIAGLKDGTIDVICSDHSPADNEHSVREFEDAHFGISSIQSTFHLALSALCDEMPLDDILHKFTHGPASVLGISDVGLAEGNQVTAFSATAKTTFDRASWASRSVNTPVMQQEWMGAVIAV